MEIKIGVQETAREISLESNDSPADVIKAVEAAINSGGLLKLEDDRGRTVVVPGSKIAYLEIGPPARGRVGFA